jgi:hypothetical protein
MKERSCHESVHNGSNYPGGKPGRTGTGITGITWKPVTMDVTMDATIIEATSDAPTGTGWRRMYEVTERDGRM